MSDQLNRPSYDPIVAEVRAVRAALLTAAGNDILEFCRRARELQQTSGHTIVAASVSPDRPAAVEQSSRSSRDAG
jgi:hypothetical protein